jgi:WD40 repeat protein
LNLKFSPDAEYSLAQDDASIFVLANDPLEFLFRIDAAEAHQAQFSPGSKRILFLTQGLRVEEWNIDDTGKGSFRVTRCFAEGDWVLVGDNENRTRVYSLSTGEQKAILFGSYSMVSTVAGIPVVENEAGQIDVYDLKSLEKRALLTFPYRISAWSFSADGKRLFVLTANQVAYVFDSQALDKAASTAAVGPQELNHRLAWGRDAGVELSSIGSDARPDSQLAAKP